MLGLVGSVWAEETAVFAPPFAAEWQRHSEEITHVFTHFRLELTLFYAQAGQANPQAGSFVPAPKPEDLPSIMRKAFVAGLAQLS
jgi:A/G-specific adenine glycosylase